MIKFQYSKKPVLQPNKNSEWASTMVLNPAIIQDKESARIHMLFRATGPYHKIQKNNIPPYPVFLGYAYSDDSGETWYADFDKPALAPALEFDSPDRLYINNINNERVLNYANGAIEDPRLFYMNSELYLIVAVRLFPPGPYWNGDFRQAYKPEWAENERNPFGKAASENVTVNVLYKVNLEELKKQEYEKAFTYITNITNPYYGEDRDVILFPEKLIIDGLEQYVLLHRPETPEMYDEKYKNQKPSIFIAASETIWGFSELELKHECFAKPLFKWESERIGASFPLIKINNDEWLLSYHGKQDNKVGYTQSFMIIERVNNNFPRIKHRCSERLMYAKQEWELSYKMFSIPCIFATGGIVINDELIISYGAADEVIGIARTCFSELVNYIRTFDEKGNKI